MKRIYVLLLLWAALSNGFVRAPASAQTPVLEVDYQNATVFHVLSDGTLHLPIGATAGYVLTTDGDGYATWQPAANGGAVNRDATLTGDGTLGAPLGVAVPLVLTGAGVGIVEGIHTSGNNGRLASNFYGVRGEHNNGNYGYLGGGFGAYGQHDNGNYGYLGGGSYAAVGENVNGTLGWLGSDTYGAYGRHDSGNYGFFGSSQYGTLGAHDNGSYGVLGTSTRGVYGWHPSGNHGYFASSSAGAYGRHNNGHWGVLGDDVSGVYGEHTNGNRGRLGAVTAAVVGIAAAGSLAGRFNGDVNVTGALSKGGGSFKIDHPLDPEGRYLSHSFVESPDMMNVYNGTVTLDARGEALVELPAYFEALNRDYRYQLTCLGGFAPVYVAEKVNGNRFKIAGGAPGLEVSWQVTGIRQDAWANENRIVVEEAKPAIERGFYIHPKLYGQPRERSVAWARDPEGMRAMREMPARRRAERHQMEEERRQIEQDRRRMQAERERAHDPLRKDP